MRLVRFGDARLGVLRGREVVDVTAAADGLDLAAPLAVPRLCAEFDRLRPRLEAAAGGPGVPLERVALLPPVASPSKILAAKATYREHAEEMAARAGRSPSEPDLVLKAPSTLVGPGGRIRLPAASGVVEHEAELAVVLKGFGKDVPAARAMALVLGYTAFIDVTLREPRGDLSRKKSYDTFGPIGPCLVTADEIPDPHALRIRLWVNGRLRQDGCTAEMRLAIPELIELASRVMTLCPGDVIATGTPAGVGPLARGDEVTIEIERIGAMTVSVEE
ncbi:MAG TPA: fumarylacetoacetate hydrolase family protein [Thermodesulfobacteriota bacterium]|nr:fumarylacetoacetate hydrolase family protein [Thermodesulfobacteriota bacterium]